MQVDPGSTDLIEGICVDKASFRDPAGHVVLAEGRVFRVVMPAALEDFEYVRRSGFLDVQIRRGRVIEESPVDADIAASIATGAARVVEHPKLPFLSHPYEWPFAALQAAALLQLDLTLDALGVGAMLSDASAYNIQFRGSEPLFIDTLSFRQYRDGEFWGAHRQFCEQFLNPLLLRSHCGVPHNAWYRGSLEGISTAELARVLPWRSRLSFNVLTHVVLQARLQRGAHARENAERVVRTRKLPLRSLRLMLESLRKWVAGLHPRASGPSIWSDYATRNNYSDDESRSKAAAVAAFAADLRPRLLWDIGCNTGEYTEVALSAGTGCAIGFDYDQGALDQAFARARANRLAFTPLHADAANPAPSQGWAQAERAGFRERANADALLALALVHHLAIGRNVPLAMVVDWLVALAPAGLVEFVPPNDPMVQRLLSLRSDAVHEYSEEVFRNALGSHAEIVSVTTVSASGRRLYRYRRFDSR